LRGPEAYVLLLGQDDPRRCTGRRVVARGLARPLYSRRSLALLRGALILNPFGRLLLPSEVRTCAALVAIDGSWRNLPTLFRGLRRQAFRRLPLLLAGNPTNYAVLGKLSTLEALAAAYYLGGFVERALGLCALVKWGSTFLALNREPLEDYRRAKGEEELLALERRYFGFTPGGGAGPWGPGEGQQAKAGGEHGKEEEHALRREEAVAHAHEEVPEHEREG